MNVWLAEADEPYGVFSTPERARQACQDVADEYFGPKNTPPLKWFEGEGFSSAVYQRPCGVLYLFQVIRFTVDQVKSL